MAQIENRNAKVKVKVIDDKLKERINDFLKAYGLMVSSGSIASCQTNEKICFLGVNMQGKGSYSPNLATKIKRNFGFDSVILNGVADESFTTIFK